VSAALVLLVSTGLACQESPPYLLGPPDGWEAEGSKWWRVDADTSGHFSDLETLASMRVKDATITLAASDLLVGQREVAEAQFARALKESLIALFRHEPQVVDSLFERYVRPKLSEVEFQSNTRELLKRHKKQGYRSIARHFREPRPSVKLGRDVPVIYPDSLRNRGVSGSVGIQVRLNAEGEPTSLWLTRPVHPILDDIALKATTQVRWQPAYLLRTGKARPLASWVRFGVRFKTEALPSS